MNYQLKNTLRMNTHKNYKWLASFIFLFLLVSCSRKEPNIPRPELKEYIFQYSEIVPKANTEACNENWLFIWLTDQNKDRGQKLQRYWENVSKEEVNDLSSKVHAGMKKEYKIINDKRSKHLKQILQNLLKALPEKEWEYSIYLIEDPNHPNYINAFAGIGGHLYMTTGMYDLADDDSELALVLGHEIGHQVNGHCHKNLLKRKKWKEFFENISIRAIRLADIATITDIFLSIPFNQADELEADLAGLYLCHAGGYSPKQGLDIYKKFSIASPKTLFNRLTRSHPFDDERVECMEVYLADAKNRANLENENALAAYQLQLDQYSTTWGISNRFLGRKNLNLLLIPSLLLWFFIDSWARRRNRRGILLRLLVFVAFIVLPAILINAKEVNGFINSQFSSSSYTIKEDIQNYKKYIVEKNARVRIKSGSLILRDEPSLNGTKTLAQMPNKSQLYCHYCSVEDRIKGKPGRWCKVNYEGMEGWAWGVHIQVEN